MYVRHVVFISFGRAFFSVVQIKKVSRARLAATARANQLALIPWCPFEAPRDPQPGGRAPRRSQVGDPRCGERGGCRRRVLAVHVACLLAARPPDHRDPRARCCRLWLRESCRAREKSARRDRLAHARFLRPTTTKMEQKKQPTNLFHCNAACWGFFSL